MKTWITLLSTCLVFFISVQAIANNDVDGIWINSLKGLTVIVESTSRGIRVKRQDQQTWYEYEEYRVGQYRDAEGNNYYLVDASKLEWEGSNGKRRIVFNKSPLPDGSIAHAIREGGNQDVHIERNHYYGETSRPSRLEGRWRNKSTGQSITIQAHADFIKVRAHRGGWTTFYREDRNTYFDSRGNRYDVLPAKVIYLSESRDFKMVFVPS